MGEEKIKEILHQAGLKYTPGRAALIDFLWRASRPLTQEEISLGLKESGLNKVSIYRALDSFLQAGLVHRLESGDRVWKFAFCGCGSRGHCHPHFICRACGKVECLTKVHLPEVAASAQGYIIEEQEVYFKGLCPGCS
ncbi:MAG TPA: Fur family transcriptional regulator [Bacillota bacterium]|nr:Fur family transcriptional regulator [Bacillota bacterium]HPT87225.1 Fur family transcriptional regulator [Bacillota bacterium]